MADKVIAVVAYTKQEAKKLAADLGVETRYLFGARSERTFEGLRADLVLIEAFANIPDGFLDTIRATVLKTPGGRIRYVRVTGGWF